MVSKMLALPAKSREVLAARAQMLRDTRKR